MVLGVAAMRPIAETERVHCKSGSAIRFLLSLHRDDQLMGKLGDNRLHLGRDGLKARLEALDDLGGHGAVVVGRSLLDPALQAFRYTQSKMEVVSRHGCTHDIERD